MNRHFPAAAAASAAIVKANAESLTLTHTLGLHCKLYHPFSDCCTTNSGYQSWSMHANPYRVIHACVV